MTDAEALLRLNDDLDRAIEIVDALAQITAKANTETEFHQTLRSIADRAKKLRADRLAR